MKTQFFKRTAIALVVGGAAVMSFSVLADEPAAPAAPSTEDRVASIENKINSDEGLEAKVNALWGNNIFVNGKGFQPGVDGPIFEGGVGSIYSKLDGRVSTLETSSNDKVSKDDFKGLSDKVENKVEKTAFDKAMSDNGARLEAVDGRVTDLASTSVHKDDFNALSTKVDGKAEKTDFDTLSSKVNRINTGLNNVNTDVEKNTQAIRESKVSIDAKAGKAYVDEKLEAKADKSEVTTALAEKASMDDVLSYHNATLDTLKDASERISKNEDQIAAINARHDKVDAEKQAKLEEELKSLEENLLQERKEEYAMLGAIADNVDEQINTLTDFTLHNFRDFDARLNRLDKQLKRGLAAQAALSGLFQPYTVGKFNATAAVGGYKSQQAVAVGAGYRFNEHVAAKAGVAFAGHGDVSYHAGVNFEW